MKQIQLDHKKYSIKGVTHRIIENSNGLKMHILDSGFLSSDQEVILLLHGFPELAFSWRYVINPLINDGYRVIAPDQRGYGMTTGGDNSYNCDLSLSPILIFAVSSPAISTDKTFPPSFNNISVSGPAPQPHSNINLSLK